MKELLVLVFMGILCVGGSFFAAVILGEMWDFVSDPPFTNEQIIKEVKKAEPLRLQGESPDFTQGQEWTMTQIKQIIKNI